MKYDGDEMQSVVVGLNGLTTGPEEAAKTADLLDRLADGESVSLGEFSTGADRVSTDADAIAATLRDIVSGLRDHYGVTAK